MSIPRPYAIISCDTTNEHSRLTVDRLGRTYNVQMLCVFCAMMNAFGGMVFVDGGGGGEN